MEGTTVSRAGTQVPDNRTDGNVSEKLAGTYFPDEQVRAYFLLLHLSSISSCPHLFHPLQTCHVSQCFPAPVESHHPLPSFSFCPLPSPGPPQHGVSHQSGAHPARVRLGRGRFRAPLADRRQNGRFPALAYLDSTTSGRPSFVLYRAPPAPAPPGIATRFPRSLERHVHRPPQGITASRPPHLDSYDDAHAREDAPLPRPWSSD